MKKTKVNQIIKFTKHQYQLPGRCFLFVSKPINVEL